MTKIIKENQLDEAAECLANGGTVVFPTETVYGLGGDAFNDAAIDKIYKAKGRPSDNPLIVHISDIGDLDKLAEYVSDNCRALADKFWPGPLTMIFPKKDSVPFRVTGGLNTVAVRFPSNPIAHELIRRSNVLVAAPSANLSGSPSPTICRHVVNDLNGRVDYIIDGEECEIGLESTVVDMTGDYPVILRPGAITLEDIQSIIPETVFDPHLNEETSRPKCPGMKYKHYAPKAKMEVVIGNKDKVREYISKKLESENNVGVMTYKGGDYDRAVCVLPGGENMHEYASRLFYNLRVFDEYGVSKIYAEFSNESGIGVAVRNRLYKSAAHNITEV